MFWVFVSEWTGLCWCVQITLLRLMTAGVTHNLIWIWTETCWITCVETHAGRTVNTHDHVLNTHVAYECSCHVTVSQTDYRRSVQKESWGLNGSQQEVCLLETGNSVKLQFSWSWWTAVSVRSVWARAHAQPFITNMIKEQKNTKRRFYWWYKLKN